MTSRVGLLALGALAFGCITKGPEAKMPEKLTAAEHERAAAQAEQRAKESEQRVDPGNYTTQRCAPVVVPPPTASYVAPQSGPSFSRPEDVCGNSSLSAIRDHQREAEQELKAAAEHRSMAAVLRRNEAVLCAGVPPALRAENPFSRPEHVLAVAPIVDRSGTGKASAERGGVVLALGEMNVEPAALEQRLNCQAAMAAVDEHPELASSPAAVPGARSSVWMEGDQLMVEISSTDSDAAKEIGQRARKLIAGATH